MLEQNITRRRMIAIAASAAGSALLFGGRTAGANQPVRWLAEGRDVSATLDGSASPIGFGKNDGDNEITGIHVSDGNTGKDGILGAKEPHPFEPDGKWRVFYTQQHGDNPTYEVIRPKK